MLLTWQPTMRTFLLCPLPVLGLGFGGISQAGSIDPILEWNAVMLEANAVDCAQTPQQQPGPVLVARAFAMTSAAMYDAFNSVESLGAPYLTKVPNSAGASVDAAVAQAAHDVLVSLYSAQAVAFDAALTETLARVPDGSGRDQGIAVGQQVAANMIQARANDGAATLDTPPYVPIDLPGFHQVDPTNPNQGFYGCHGANLSAFAMTSSDQFVAPALDDASIAGRAAFLLSAQYTTAYAEVFAVGGDGITTTTTRTPEQTEISIFWGYDGRPGLGKPPRLYNQIVRVLAAQENNTAEQNARLFGLVNLAMGDAAITAWARKYTDQFWRPIMGIRHADSTGNPDTPFDPNWTPLGAQPSNPFPGEISFTPPWPAYPSGHATLGGAVFKMLERFYGTDDVTFSVISDEFNGITRGIDGKVRPLVARTFHSFSDAAQENGQSRIYLGVHWGFDRDEGIKSGKNVADYVFDNFLQPNQ
jgi:hypothetical protein